MKSTKNEEKLIDLSVISSIIFILASLVSLTLTLDDRAKLSNKKYVLSNKQKLDISFYNRIVILIAVSISLYVGYNNYKNENNKNAKYKSSLLLTTNILTLISSIIILYVAYLNKEEQTLNPANVENPLI